MLLWQGRFWRIGYFFMASLWWQAYLSVFKEHKVIIELICIKFILLFFALCQKKESQITKYSIQN